MESDYQSLFQVRLANYDDIPAIMNITREAFVKYQQMSGVEKLAALEESFNSYCSLQQLSRLLTLP